MKIFIYPPWTRVRVCHGRFPVDPEMIGRTGRVVKVDEYHPDRYGVVLDGETAIRDFAQEELEAIEAGAAVDEAGNPGHGMH